MGRLCGRWGDCFGTPGWGPGGRPGSKTPPTPARGAKRQPGFRRSKVDKGLLADRAVSEIGSRRRRRPLPAVSPASEAGARLASHLLRIAAAAASSRASPAPGMQRQGRRGGAWGGRSARTRPSPPLTGWPRDGAGVVGQAGVGEPLASNIPAGRHRQEVGCLLNPQPRSICLHALAADCPAVWI